MSFGSDRQNAIQKIHPNGVVSVVMRAHCRQRAGSGSVPQLYNCIGCLGWDPHGTGYVNDIFMCPEWLSVDRRGDVYYVDADSNMVHVVDPAGRTHLLAGGGRCAVARLSRCGRRVQATQVRLRDAAGNGRVPAPALHRSYSPHVPATAVAIVAEAVTVDPWGNVYFLDDTGAVHELVG